MADDVIFSNLVISASLAFDTMEDEPDSDPNLDLGGFSTHSNAHINFNALLDSWLLKLFVFSARSTTNTSPFLSMEEAPIILFRIRWFVL